MTPYEISALHGKRVHFIGVGGCSMNGLAQILHSLGIEVSGSDKASSPFLEKLQKMGLDVRVGHKAELVDGAALVVYSAAIKPENVEYARAKALDIPTMERSVLLGAITRNFKNVIAIAGCHGKTTITSMLARIVLQAGHDATVHVGGDVDFLLGGTRVGSGDIFITEACEYVESFLHMQPTTAAINNIDDDHLDYFRDIDHIISAFERFVSLLPENGTLYYCMDDVHTAQVAAKAHVKTVGYSIRDTRADLCARNIHYDENGFPSCDIYFHGEELFKLKLNVPGVYNITNALCAISIALSLNIPTDIIADALWDYRLTRRRFEYYGTSNDVRYYHDYAHHPNEIQACLQGAARQPHNKLWCVFQCNSYTRAQTLKDKYARAFGDADTVIVPAIYPGREVDTGIIHARDLCDAIAAQGTDCIYLETFPEIKQYLAQHAKPGDIVLALGSGDVYIQARSLLKP